MVAITLTPAERKALRARAHHLDPVVSIGADGLTEAVLNEADAALRAHGLIKLRMFSDTRTERDAALLTLADRLGAGAVQHIGKLLVLWRPKPAAEKAPTEAGRGAPRVVKILKFPKHGRGRPEIKKVTVYGNQRVTAGGTVKRSRVRPTSVKKKAQV